MQTNVFVKRLGEAVNKMAEKGEEVYVHTTETCHQAGRYQTIRTALFESPKEALNDIHAQRRAAEKAGIPWEFEEHWKDHHMEVGESEVLCIVEIKHLNGDKTDRVDYIARVR